MKLFSKILSAFAVIALLALAPSGAFANGTTMCGPEISNAATGAKRVVNPNTNNGYNLNGNACAYIAQADVGYFLSQGYTYGGNTGTIIFTTGVATSTTDFVIGNLPANALINSVAVTNATSNAVTGGISLGSAANGTQFLSAMTCAANCVSGTTAITAATVYSTTAPVALHAAAVTAWNNANVTITVTYSYF